MALYQAAYNGQPAMAAQKAKAALFGGENGEKSSYNKIMAANCNNISLSFISKRGDIKIITGV